MVDAQAHANLIWPNAESRANSDPWLVANHDRIRLMRPRVLVVNYVHRLSERAAWAKVDALRAALRESSRWHGYADPHAPAFLEYEVVGIVDRTEPRGRVDRNSARFPRASDGVGFDYSAMYEDLGLAALVADGRINEVWFLADHTDRSAPWETVEVKRTYDQRLRPVGHTLWAGNSGGHTAPWIGRSLRLLFINHARGVGCAMESLGHSLERMATCGAIPYYERYFREYAGLDLDRRYGLPFESFYGQSPIDYARLPGYVAAGGNVHFMPNGRFDYDLDGGDPIPSTIETWREPGSAPRPWTPTRLRAFANLAPDCMGRWVVYWRQNMPGLGNAARDDDGHPMKNWWPFLFY